MNSKKYGFNPRINPAVAPLAAAIGLALGASSLQAATITVTTLVDGSVPGQCTLRDALVAANGDGPAAGCTPGLGADTIVFQPGLNGTITLTSSTLPILSDVTINGPGPEQLTISGGNNYRVMAANGPVTAQINGVRLANGYSNDFYGGAGLLVVDSSLTLSNCEIANNAGGPNAYGGGITLSSADLTVDNCVITGNSVAGGMLPRGVVNAFGGGILAVNSQASITGTDFLDNSAYRYGGGLALVGSIATITASNFNGNEALIGGGISVGDGSQLSLDTSSLIDNFAGAGGGIAIGAMGYAGLGNVEIYGNTAPYFGGGALIGVGYSAPMPLAAPRPAETLFGTVNFGLTGPGEMLMTDGYVAFNATEGSGGGVAAKYQSNVQLEDTGIAYNQAVPPVAPRSSISFANRGTTLPRGRGGGLAAVDTSYIEGLGVNLRSNYAAYGGGAFADRYGAVLLQTSIISSNQAEIGAGMLGGFFDPAPTPRDETDRGGAPAYDGVVAAADSLVSGNQGQYGGGLSSLYGGLAVAKYSNVENNSASGSGGGVLAYQASLLVIGTSINNNQADTGGGVYTIGTLGQGSAIAQSTISNNTAATVGGVFLQGPNESMKYSTIANNTAGIAAGVAAIGALGNEVAIVNSTVTNNTGNTAAGIYAAAAQLDFLTVSHNTSNGMPAPRSDRWSVLGGAGISGGGLLGGNTQVTNSIFSDNISPGGAIDLIAINSNALDYSLVETPGTGLPAGIGNLLATDPQLGILAANGGPTATRAIGSGSPVLDLGSPGTTLGNDQRGEPYPRVFNGRADMGAFEFSIDGVFQDRFEQP